MHKFYLTSAETSPWPAVDIFENEDSIVFEADLPGVVPEDIEVKVVGDILIIEGKRKELSASLTAVNYICIERTFRSFRRVLHIPVPIDVSTGLSLYEKGVLTISFEKLRNRVYRIPVKRAEEGMSFRLKREVVINDRAE